MVAGYEWISPTRLVGLTAYGASLLACLARWVSCRKSRVAGRPFALLSAAQLFLLLDMAFDWRWKLHGFWMQEAAALGVYDQRRLPQAMALGLLLLASAIGCFAILARFRIRPGLTIAVMGTLLSLGLWCCECISLHMLDQIFYRLVRGVMLVSLLWAALALVTCFGAWRDGRDHLSVEPQR
jgi:hypothetical protein